MKAERLTTHGWAFMMLFIDQQGLNVGARFSQHQVLKWRCFKKRRYLLS